MTNYLKFSLFHISLLVICLALPTCALSGFILSESGDPIENAAIKLCALDTVVYSKENGAFQFSGTSLVSGFDNEIKNNVKMYGNTISFDLLVSTSISLKIFNIKGQCLYDFKMLTPKGKTSFLLPDLADGLYIITGLIGQTQINIKTFKSAKRFNWLGGDNKRISQERRVRALDTLLISKHGYESLVVPIEEYETELDTVIIRERLFYFNVDSMQYNKVVELGDSLIVPVSVKSNGMTDYNLSTDKGVIKTVNNNEKLEDDTLLIYLPTENELGLNQVYLEVYKWIWNDTSGERISDTFQIAYELIYPSITLEQNYSIRAGDTLLIPLKAELSGEGVQVESNIGEVIRDSIFQFVSKGSDEGVHNVTFTCLTSTGSTKKYSTSIYVLPFHELKVGDSWAFIHKEDYRNFHTSAESVKRILQTISVETLSDDEDSTYIVQKDESIHYHFETSYGKPIDSIQFGDTIIEKCTISIAKDYSSVLTGDNHYKSVLVNRYQFRFFDHNMFDPSSSENTYHEYFKIDTLLDLSGNESVYKYYYSNLDPYDNSSYSYWLSPGYGKIKYSSGKSIDDGYSKSLIIKMIQCNDQPVFNDSLNIEHLLDSLQDIKDKR